MNEELEDLKCKQGKSTLGKYCPTLKHVLQSILTRFISSLRKSFSKEVTYVTCTCKEIYWIYVYHMCTLSTDSFFQYKVCAILQTKKMEKFEKLTPLDSGTYKSLSSIDIVYAYI